MKGGTLWWLIHKNTFHQNVGNNSQTKSVNVHEDGKGPYTQKNVNGDKVICLEK